MARSRYPNDAGPLPPPLPPETRTVGQLVAETLRIYGQHVWKALAIGVAPAIVNLVGAEIGGWSQIVFSSLVGSVVYTASYIVAVGVVADVPISGRHAFHAFAAGVLVFLVFPFLAALFLVPGIAWLALVGLAVPAALIERLGVRDSFRRGLELGRADYVHALGGITTLGLTVLITQAAIAILLREYADLTIRIAGVLAGIVLTPVLLLGAALLYFDQAARVGRRDASVPAQEV